MGHQTVSELVRAEAVEALLLAEAQRLSAAGGESGEEEDEEEWEEVEAGEGGETEGTASGSKAQAMRGLAGGVKEGVLDGVVQRLLRMQVRPRCCCCCWHTSRRDEVSWVGGHVVYRARLCLWEEVS